MGAEFGVGTAWTSLLLPYMEQSAAYNILTFEEDSGGNYQWAISLPGIPGEVALNNPAFVFFRNIYVREIKQPKSPPQPVAKAAAKAEPKKTEAKKP